MERITFKVQECQNANLQKYATLLDHNDPSKSNGINSSFYSVIKETNQNY